MGEPEDGEKGREEREAGAGGERRGAGGERGGNIKTGEGGEIGK